MNIKMNLLVFIFKIIPTGFLSRIFGYFASIPMPALFLDPIIRWYSKKFQVKTNEYDHEQFRTLDQFFTRKLKPGVHVIHKSPDSIVSPVDGRIDRYGDIDNESLMQAKGIEYTLGDLIPSDFHENFTGGSFVNIYLSPGDYHRIHSPVSGNILGYFNIPGRLFTVQEYMVNGLPGLFTKNERIISYIKTEYGLAAVCKIGAMNVGRITLSYADAVTNKLFKKRKEFFYRAGSFPVISKGEELGTFHLGSTVIILFQKRIKFDGIEFGKKVRVGQKIGKF